jgi:pimeloyl-ACP methyl ester carboxylesterase
LLGRCFFLVVRSLTQARERIEADLGDADSRFRDLGNLLVHVKVKSPKTLPPALAQNPAAARYAPPASVGDDGVAAVHCYHGFGSNTWSWTLVQGQIAERLGALVTAHDMPGFGLTQRWVLVTVLPVTT